MNSFTLKKSEVILILSGFTLIAGLVAIFFGQSFLIWTLGKALYGVGALLFILNL